MSIESIEKFSERNWKHRFAQTLWDFFSAQGVPRSAALDDAYAHADAHYLVRSLASPEDEARSALHWIWEDAPQTNATPVCDKGMLHSNNGIQQLVNAAAVPA